MPRKKDSHLSKAEHDNLVRLCSAVASDPYRMCAAVMVLLESVNANDAEWLKLRLRITGDNSQAPKEALK